MWGNPFQFFSKTVDAFIDWCVGRVPQPAHPVPQLEDASIKAMPIYSFDFSLPQLRSTTWYGTLRIEDYLSARLKSHEFIAFWGSCSIFQTATYKAFYKAKALTDDQLWTQVMPYHDKQVLIFLDNSSPPGSKGLHWQAYVFNRADYKLYKFDGLNWSARPGVVSEIKNHIKKIWPEDNRDIQYTPVDIPKQPNHWDCGPTVCWIVDRIALQGIQNLLDWVQSYRYPQYDYGAFRANVDALLGSEAQLLPSSSNTPFIFSRAAGTSADPILLDSDEENEDLFKEFGTKRTTRHINEGSASHPIDLDSDSESDQPDKKKQRI